MSRGQNLHAPFVLAFSAIEAIATEAPRASSDSYPPYNIERILAQGSEAARLRITLAVAGFTPDQIAIVLEREQLVIRGRQKDDRERRPLHRGIAMRQFQRVFVLAEAMRVEGASLYRGLLQVELAPA